jgi:hypothetical protein
VDYRYINMYGRTFWNLVEDNNEELQIGCERKDILE